MNFIGRINLNGTVRVTDPCYDDHVGSQIIAQCSPGTYRCYYEYGEDVPRASKLTIEKEGGSKLPTTQFLGYVSVDAGLAGFFANKPNFSRDQWNHLCDSLYIDNNEGEDAWLFKGLEVVRGEGEIGEGVFSQTGYGDGDYSVYTNQAQDAFEIVFIEDGNGYDDYDECYEEDDCCYEDECDW